mmetsp:Transcript_125083/g.186845  ORF Transcript_125083/g.186845 Transcript_125083/m.186845 type:complete len:85 (-) Transcript_125083:91-345(-)
MGHNKRVDSKQKTRKIDLDEKSIAEHSCQYCIDIPEEKKIYTIQMINQPSETMFVETVPQVRRKLLARSKQKKIDYCFRYERNT